jgi:FecR protein
VRLLAQSLFLLTLLVTGVTNAWSADGRILSFEGDVRVNGKPVTANTELRSEDTIVTAAGASVKIVLSDNSVLDIDSDSNIKLSDYSYNPAAPKENKSEISVVEGTLRYVSGLIAKEDPGNIGFTAGNSTIGVRGSFTGIDVDGGTVNVEAMIGEATLIRKDGSDTILVPPGQTTQTDPTTGKTVVTASTVPNAVNEVVHAIAAMAPDASNRLPGDEGCSQGDRPLRSYAVPAADPEAAAAIEAQMAALSKGELMMVMVVLINNAGHLCIDAATVANTITTIATVRPDAVAAVVVVATLLDPVHAEKFTESATPPPAAQETKPPVTVVDPPINNQIPPGGGTPPSPE